MDPIEQKPRHLYPNADRSSGDDNSIMPKGDNLGNKLSDSGLNVGIPKDGSLVHPPDVLQQESTGGAADNYKNVSIHTLKDDMASEAAKGGFSVGKIMAANDKKLHQTAGKTANIGERNKHVLTKIIVFLSCILIISVFSYIGFKSAKTPEQISRERNPSQQIAGNILYSEISVPLTMEGKNRTTLLREVLGESSIKVPSGKIKSLIFLYNATSTSSILASEFLNIIAPSAPDLLVRNLKDEYVFGYYTYESNEPFIILKSSDYESVFAGMLDWEKSMYADLGDLIYKKNKEVDALTSTSTSSASQATPSTTITPATATIPATTPTSTTTTKTPAQQTKTDISEYDAVFIDRVISNNDARVLYRPNGEIAFFYTFFNKDTLIIATSEQTLKEIIYRLTSGKITR